MSAQTFKLEVTVEHTEGPEVDLAAVARTAGEDLVGIVCNVYPEAGAVTEYRIVSAEVVE
jgi:hypothetical protein